MSLFLSCDFIIEIYAWATSRGIEYIVWTALPPKFIASFHPETPDEKLQVSAAESGDF
jgi:alpha-galactosidase/6-phospho-beta-glucosidase family protein